MLKEAQGHGQGYPSPARAWGIVAILIVAAMLSYVDRQVIAIVAQPMKADLKLTDTALSLLYSAFAIFYALAALPLGRMADVYNRKWLITIAIVIWSMMTMACGMTRNYILLFLARIGVGVGEAALVPASNSMVADLFPREKVPLALSFFQTGSVMGSGIAFIVGGATLSFMNDLAQQSLPIFDDMAAWQLCFIALGIPGVLVVLMMLFLREPVRRSMSGAVQTTPRQAAPMPELMAFYRRNWKTFTFHHLGFLAFALSGFALVFWTLPFFTRVHGVDTALASQIFGWMFFICGPLGVVWAAMQAAWFSKRGRRDANIISGLIGGALTMPVIILIQLMPNATWAFILYVPVLFFANAPFGLAYGALPVITPPAMRAQVTAFYMLFLSSGMAFGPVIAGIFNDHLFPGTDGVRYSLMTLTSICGVLGTLSLWACRKPYIRSLEDADAMEAQGRW